MRQEIIDILRENEMRNAIVNTTFDPITGEGSVGERFRLDLPDFVYPVQYLPVQMKDEPLVQQFIRLQSLKAVASATTGKADNFSKGYIVYLFIRLRSLYDFPFWAASFIHIKAKGGGDTLFHINRPQRKLLAVLERMRTANLPIRIILLKARQWGGSTLIQIYMAWLQLIHRKGLNSLIVAHQGSASDEIKNMFDRAISEYPLHMLYPYDAEVQENETKLEGVGRSGSIQRVPQRDCNIKIGTAERPDSSRGGDYNLVHCSEIGLWKTTEGKRPEDIVRSACSGVLLQPYTMIAYESTANGMNFFQREYDDAKAGRSQFEALFIAWFEIEQYSLPIDNPEEFATRLYNDRESTNIPSTREDSGQYLWWLWQKGATLEAINWYIQERAKYNDHSQMASEYPSDDIEAFVHYGARVFDRYKVEVLRPSCCPPHFIGELFAHGDTGKDAIKNLRFNADTNGSLYIWNEPEPDTVEDVVTDRYVTVVDVGGRSDKADFSVIVVFDRMFMIDGGKPMVVAQWYGHCDIDILAWRAAQVAAYYNNSLLVIESNTLETHDRERNVDGDQSMFILNQIKDIYPNLYARRQSEEDIRQGAPRKYGFHTNIATKPMVISTLVKAIRENLYVERDYRCLDEYLCYERKPNGAFGAIAGKHDDLLMTRAIGLHICFFEMDLPAIVPRKGRFSVTNKRPATMATI